MSITYLGSGEEITVWSNSYELIFSTVN